MFQDGYEYGCCSGEVKHLRQDTDDHELRHEHIIPPRTNSVHLIPRKVSLPFQLVPLSGLVENLERFFYVSSTVQLEMSIPFLGLFFSIS